MDVSLRMGQQLLHLAVQQVQVGAAPAVDALLDVPHHQRTLPAVDGVLEQRPEVLPLQAGGILELVEHEVVVAGSHLFIDEWRIAAVDDSAQDVGRLGEQHQVVFLEQRRQVGIEVGDDTQQVDVAVEQFGSGRRLLVAGGHHLLEFQLESRDLFLVPQAIAVFAAQAQELLFHQQVADLVELGGDIPFLAGADLVQRIVGQPLEQRLVAGFVKRSHHPVHRQLQHGILVKLHLVGGILVDLPREGAHHRLEKAVDGADGEGDIVVQDGRECLLRVFFHLRRGGPVVREFIIRLVDQVVEFLDDAALHLLGSLVGEGHRQDVTEGLRIERTAVGRDEQFHILPCERPGLSAAGGCLDNL